MRFRFQMRLFTFFKYLSDKYHNNISFITTKYVNLLITYRITFYKQHILIYQHHLYFDNIARKYTDDHIV